MMSLQAGGVDSERRGHLGGSEGLTEFIFPLDNVTRDSQLEWFFSSGQHETLLAKSSVQSMNKCVRKYIRVKS